MSATEESRSGGASAGIAQTVRTGPLLAVEPREPAATGDLGRLGEVVLPADARTAAGAARIVIGHCLTGLVSRRTEALRVEIDNPGTRRGTGCFEMGRA